MNRVCFGVFVISAAVVLFFLAFNYSVPHLKHRVDHAILNSLSRIGALVYPFALGMTGIGYAGIILTSRRAKFKADDGGR